MCFGQPGTSASGGWWVKPLKLRFQQPMTTICNFNGRQGTRRNLRSSLLWAAVTPFWVSTLCAQIVEYPIEDLGNGPTPTSLSAINVDANIAASSLSMNGMARISWAQSLSSSDFPVGAIDTAKNYEFTITPNSGFTVSYSTLTYGIWKLNLSGGAVSNWELHASTDGFATSDLTLATHSIPSGPLGDATFSTDISALGTQSGTVTFRFYAYDVGFSGSPGGLAHRDADGGWTANGSNVLLGGSVSPVPEVETMALVSGAALMVFAAYRRRG